jgi:preprotein translocase subunit SecD
MLDFPRWKVWLVILSLIGGIVFAIPTFLPAERFNQLPGFLQVRVNLGLDLSGGSHILLEADPAEVAKQRLVNMEEQVRTELRRGNPRIAIGDISRTGNKLSFMVRDPSQVDAAV